MVALMNRDSGTGTANRRILRRSALVVIIMFGFGFAMAPFYDVVCRALGVGGKTGTASEPAATAEVDESRTVTVEFTGNAMAGLPWEFRPSMKKIDVHPGQPTTVTYFARNMSAEKIIGQAVPSVTPAIAATYFKKIECFCFTQQPLAPGESREMSVRFFVDRALPADVRTLTLSYGFFNTNIAQAKRFGGEALGVASHGPHGG
jgi:cytochrome c oxidase assembly protein subunit 11